MHFGPGPNACSLKRERKLRPLFPPNLHFLPQTLSPGERWKHRPLTAIFPPGFGREFRRGFSFCGMIFSLSLFLSRLLLSCSVFRSETPVTWKYGRVYLILIRKGLVKRIFNKFVFIRVIEEVVM